jgi:hypothetical protein
MRADSDIQVNKKNFISINLVAQLVRY